MDLSELDGRRARRCAAAARARAERVWLRRQCTRRMHDRGASISHRRQARHHGRARRNCGNAAQHGIHGVVHVAARRHRRLCGAVRHARYVGGH